MNTPRNHALLIALFEKSAATPDGAGLGRDLAAWLGRSGELLKHQNEAMFNNPLTAVPLSMIPLVGGSASNVRGMGWEEAEAAKVLEEQARAIKERSAGESVWHGAKSMALPMALLGGLYGGLAGGIGGAGMGGLVPAGAGATVGALAGAGAGALGGGVSGALMGGFGKFVDNYSSDDSKHRAKALLQKHPAIIGLPYGSLFGGALS